MVGGQGTAGTLLTRSETKGSTLEFGQRLEQRELKSYLLCQDAAMTTQQ